MRVVVGFTTIPSRFKDIEPMVKSIEAQTHKPDRFVLWAPTCCQKESAEYVKPDWLAQHPELEVAEWPRDWGSATKLIPTLMTETDPETLVVTVDDDVQYERHLVEEFVAAAKRWPGESHGLMGCTQGPTFTHAEQVAMNGWERFNVLVLGGYRGVAHKRHLFDDSIIEEADELLRDGPFVADDQLISWNLMRRDIKRAVIATKYPGPSGGVNFKFLGLGGGIYQEEGHKTVSASLERLKALYDRNEWRRSR